MNELEYIKELIGNYEDNTNYYNQNMKYYNIIKQALEDKDKLIKEHCFIEKIW